jgi:hypothetical protein
MKSESAAIIDGCVRDLKASIVWRTHGSGAHGHCRFAFDIQYC